MSGLVVAFTVYNRPGYFRETLTSWAEVRSVEDVAFIFCLEPGPRMREMHAVIDEWPLGGYAAVVVNDERLGCQLNSLKAVQLGFDLRMSKADERPSDFVALAEDDEVVGRDIVEYYRWAAEEYRDQADVAVVCAHQPYSGQGAAGEVHRLSFLFSQGWGTWRDRWERFISPTWDFGYAHGGWDANLLRVMRERGVPNAVFPAISRTQHIGRFGGEHTRPQFFSRTQAAEFDPGVDAGGVFREVPVPAGSRWHEAVRSWVPPGPGKPG